MISRGRSKWVTIIAANLVFYHPRSRRSRRAISPSRYSNVKARSSKPQRSASATVRPEVMRQR